MILEDFNQIKNSSIDWNRFANKTILITGANGFLPAYMVETLLLLNNDILKYSPCKVIALVRNEKHTKERFSNYLSDDNFKIIVQDVANQININEKIDYIIHAASPASPKYYNIDPVGVIMPNVLGTKNTLELARKNNIEGYLYFSSGEVYGQLNDGEVINEDKYGYLDPTTVRACYGESKRMGENLCVSYGHQYNIPVKIVRPFHTYGPGMKLDDGRVFSDFVKNIVNNEDIEMKSDGSATRAFCYLADATVGFFKILLEGKNNNAYNLANSNGVISIKDLATELVNMFPEKGLKAIFAEQNKDYLQSPVKGNSVDTSKLEALDWKATTTIKDGFKKTIRSYL
ncbi:NAD-dependent epimerase/dehydratase family protein [Aliarcobacter cryaerophilus]|uniref:NAD-dependent epimerase/dehydratase family protein n=1 Tax=Aliarcobacter cryaerophilus TaxID=28198 RepID=UPI0021B34403|nr:NAD-dependent epimerase/dehydratase family protein [Aliarcobacter cryaerophilus]MCT7445512.1 NAD-dependent epimerase/dehydratase family protein [Aliarcobacter cryaerophilus]MCT7480424.1 NAD-dependent epimerase/dehydratase family protein [Aliarcobacter cryaerophilus]